MAVGRVHLLYGLAGSGKTTLARELSNDGHAVRFTLDEWMLRVHPGLSFESVEYRNIAGQVRELIWTIAEQVLMAGVDVVLDWNSWSLARRGWAIERASALGAPVILHRLTASLEVASARVRDRTDRGTHFAHHVTAEDNEHLASLMEDPSSEENLEIRDH
ncbi:AAA family ATPase [Ornithinimicrobium cryptoxanthini]|uniref:AAA family ATPase n=1 Tax=Ornithinimicrobium cryptoxanthini TaxID=2934161 RepID=UPI00211878BF|nr:ATP-binding protein [Ornithinimicrobium cryptoxanthini]